jgi:hypothetical protein
LPADKGVCPASALVLFLTLSFLDLFLSAESSAEFKLFATGVFGAETLDGGRLSTVLIPPETFCPATELFSI